MKNKSFILLLAIVAGLVWLHPPRSLDPPTVSAMGAVVEITYMGPGGPLSGAMADAVRVFELNSRRSHAADHSQPAYRVISGQSAARDQVADPTRFLLSVAGGAPPDVICFDRFAVAEWAARNAFEPLDKYIATDREAGATDVPCPDRYFGVCWNEAVFDGRLYGVPISVDDRLLYYNKDLLVKAGLVYQEGTHAGQASPPRTWEELRDYTVRLTEWHDACRTRLKIVGFAPNFGNSWLYIYGWMNGGRFLSPDGRTCTLNDPRIGEALSFMKAIYDSIGGYRKVRGFETGFGSNELDPFVLGQVAMVIDGNGRLSNLATHAPDLNFGVAAPPLPAAELAALSPQRRAAHLTMSWSGGWALAIPRNARHKQAAWELIRFLTGDEGSLIRLESERQMAESQGRLFLPELHPVRDLNRRIYEQYVATNLTLPSTFRDAYRVAMDLLPFSRHRPVCAVGQRLWNAHRDAMEEALYGEEPQAALDFQTANVQRYLDRFYREKIGRPIRSWTWFFFLYGAVIMFAGIFVYLWDTSPAVRRATWHLAPWLGGDVVPGARGGLLRAQWKDGYLCAAPWIIGFVVLTGGPILFSIVMSLCDYDIINTPRFIGLGNFRTMFTRDHLFYRSLANTAFMVLGVPLGMAVSLALALLLNQKIRAVGLWRTVFYLPAIVPMVAASVLFISIFNSENGLINGALRWFGISGPNWLSDEYWSKPSIILMGLWGAGGGMIIWLAGLSGISGALYEAAAIDGAGPWARFRHVTVPQLTPYIFFNLVIGLIATFQIFGQAFIMTGGGPNNSTLFYVYHLFNHAFRYGDMGYASALAWVLFAFVMVLTVIQLRFSRHWVHYEST